MDIPNTPVFLTAAECAARYNISERHFKRLVSRGELPKPLKFGRNARWSVKALEEHEIRNTSRKTSFFDPTALLKKKKRGPKKKTR